MYYNGVFGRREKVRIEKKVREIERKEKKVRNRV
jgi:hypothetical protein